jgi:hypothetical protein
MKKIYLLIAVICICNNVTKAQTWITDSVSMGTGRINDIYYHMGNGVVKTVGNKNWFLALGTASQQAGAYINSANGVACFNPHKGLMDWATITMADTATSTEQINSDSNWTNGALNRGKQAGQQFDYGFGKYNSTLHTVIGDSIFIIRQGSSYYKLRIDSVFGQNSYAVTIGGLSLPIPSTQYIFNKAPKFGASNFIYVNATSMGLVDTAREPAQGTWDFVITEYKTNIAGTPYLVVGALSDGSGSEVFRAQGISANVAAANYTTATYEKYTNMIGYDWKVFNGSTYDYDSLNSYLVHSNDGSFYQIQFNGYVKSNGYVAFNKRKIGAPTAIDQINNIATSIGVYPNPTAQDAMLTLESKEATDVVISITDMHGKTIQSFTKNIQKGTNVYTIPTQQLASGNYAIVVIGTHFKAAQLFVKQ